MKTETPKTIYLKDYKPYPFEIKHIDLDFDIHEGYTIVTATTQFVRMNEKAKDVFLNGEHLELIYVKVNGVKTDKFKADETSLRIPTPQDLNEDNEFTIEIQTRIKPEENTRLEGLYKSGDTYCTQCEAEGFRSITYYPDRPDVMTIFTTRIEADKEKYPVLLGNGNLQESGDANDNRHFAIWHDPWKKPCYLFALVAGNLVHIHDTFKTMSGKEVDLYIYVRPGDENQCDHAMESLKKSMKWEEDVYGLEYDLEIFNIVAVGDFNMGAMENKSLNIFNTALVLAHQETATDTDFIRVESVIAHEYFHNWSGNRVTCRDWFQLSLKEGLTVFRDQEFSSDLNSRAVQRIDDVQHLRRFQFPEDAGPLAHPIRPDNYIEINNFYTMTVYEKGAEIIRMFHTILGPDNYRKATDLYFSRHDGEAATCEDWIACMQEFSPIDLTQFRLWYEQAGTPEIKFSGDYNAVDKTYTVKLSQTIPDTPGQKNKKPMHIPVKIGLVAEDGQDIKEETLHLTEEKQEFIIEDVASKPVPSVLRNFSAPVKLKTDLSDEQLAFLLVHDNDGFNQWETGQTYFLRTLNRMIDEHVPPPADFFEIYGALLERASDPATDKALLARAISLPDIPQISLGREFIDPRAIYDARDELLNLIVDELGDKLVNIYEDNIGSDKFSITPEAMGQRVLCNTAMLIASNKRTAEDESRCVQHYERANNMTDRMAALYLACALDGVEAGKIVTDFYERFKTYPLVVDKWFSAQAMIPLSKTIDKVRDLRNHPDFNIKNPNRVRSLYAAFAMNNPVRFHAKDGSGYEFLRDAIIELNTINPQIAARLLTPLRDWKRYTPGRQKLMQKVLEEILAIEDISPNVFEIASKSLKG